MPPNDADPPSAPGGGAIGRITPAKVPADQAKPGSPGPAAGSDRSGEQPTGQDSPSPGQPAPSGKRRAVSGQEREFLPAALEILETPANPAGRAIAISLAVFFTIAVAWAFFGQIDIVAVTQGKIVPDGGVKQIQPLEIANVRAIHVRDGVHVDEGDILIELDPTESEVDVDQLKRERMEAAVDVARLQAYIRGLDRQPHGYDPDPFTFDPMVVAMNRNRLLSDLASFDAEWAAQDAELSRRIADREAIQAEVAKLRELLPLLADREKSLRQLMENGHTPKPVWQEAKTFLIETQHDLKIQGHRLSEAESGMQAAVKEQARLRADRLRAAYEELAEAQNTLAQSTLALRKAERRADGMVLRAPVSGTVQQLAVKTIGGVVQPAEPLMVIVPDDAPLVLEVQVLNKDTGWIEAGLDTEIKLEAFPFTKYGTLTGVVLHLSRDAVEDENLGLVFTAKVSLDQTEIMADGRPVPLQPGMAASAEIKTGKRPIIEFVLSPILRYQDEAARER